MKILFITSSRIGDAILSTGALNYMVEKNPGISVTVAAAPLTLPLFENVPGLSRLIPLEKKSFSRHWLKLWQQCRQESWDMIIDIRSSMVSYFLKAGTRYVWKSSNAQNHRVEQIGKLIHVTPPPPPHLWLGPDQIQRASALIPESVPVLALAPAANWIGKQWSPTAFAALSDLFLKHVETAKIAIFAAPHEACSIQTVIKAIPEDKCLDLVGNLSLLEVAACLKRCRAFVGNDSGLMHMAAAVGTPTIGLFGPSDDRLYGPYAAPSARPNKVVRIPEPLEQLKKTPGFSFHAPYSYMDSLKPEIVFQVLQKTWDEGI